MEGECSGGGNPSLLGLPSRGNFTSLVPSSSLGGLRVYVCEREPGPEVQVVKTDSTNILIRSLMLKKPKEKEGQDAKGTETGRRKRMMPLPPKAESSKPSKKKKKEVAESGSVSYDGYTVEMLRAALKDMGLPVKGRKNELLARIQQASSSI